ncbi:hypothetical protein F511_39557 [Dorcoceras hygrometricum]|uniref:Uncharacterized protein n=1 Tax=Dorcoceras hygrometricum TaxID=472368 RepID=A0A2Z7CFS9_9LAMI|nr:hypothetical protein F511_39557 [Dorcoceras hygrometricum]
MSRVSLVLQKQELLWNLYNSVYFKVHHSWLTFWIFGRYSVTGAEDKRSGQNALKSPQRIVELDPRGGSGGLRECGGPDGSNVTNLGSNRGLTREIWTLQVDAFACCAPSRPPASLNDRSPCSGTNAGALPTGTLPFQTVPRRPATVRTMVPRERTTLEKATHRAAPLHTARGVSIVPDGSTTISRIRNTPRPP